MTTNVFSTEASKPAKKTIAKAGGSKANRQREEEENWLAANEEKACESWRSAAQKLKKRESYLSQPANRNYNERRRQWRNNQHEMYVNLWQYAEEMAWLLIRSTCLPSYYTGLAEREENQPCLKRSDISIWLWSLFSSLASTSLRERNELF